MSAEKNLKVALIQLFVTDDKPKNLENAFKFIQIAKNNGCDLAILPECFNSPYGTNFFPKYAEEIPNGETSKALSEYAKTLSIYIVGGSFPESDNGKLYNTCTVWNPLGELIAKHRKVHLFNVNIPGKITFQEKDVLTPGSTFNMFEIGNVKVGLAICHDSRFPELAQYYQMNGCKFLIYPGAFCGTLGPPHWELLLRSRALDNQMYVAGVSSARDLNADYVSYGHSVFVSHYGEVEAKTGYDEDIIYGCIDLKKLDEFRDTVPILKQKRSDLYEIKYYNQ